MSNKGLAENEPIPINKKYGDDRLHWNIFLAFQQLNVSKNQQEPANSWPKTKIAFERRTLLWLKWFSG